MEIKDLVGAGVLVAGLTAGVAMTQNQVQISGSGRTDLAPVQTAPASGAGTAGVAFADSKPLALNRIVDEAFVTGLVVHNPHCAAQDFELGAHLLDRNGNPLDVTVDTGSPRTNIEAGGYARMGIKIKRAPGDLAGAPAATGSCMRVFNSAWAALWSSPPDYKAWTTHLPAKGMLVLTRHAPPGKATPEPPCNASSAGPTRTPRELVLQPPLPSTVDTGVLLAAFGLALIVTLIAAVAIFLLPDVLVLGRMGEVAFDFRNSWGANVAVGAGVLTALTSGTLLAQDQYSSNSTTYLLLASLFTALVPLGAALYGLLRPATAGLNSTPAQGYILVYLLSTAVVLWGAFGQLLLLGMILTELRLARVLAPEPAGLLQALTKGMMVVLAIYAATSAYATVIEGSKGGDARSNDVARPRTAMI